jgi:GDSL-like Lipase/Acylhydrolase
MATASEGLRPETDEATQQRPPRTPSQAEGGAKSLGSLRHLFGPAALVAAVWLVAIAAALFVWGIPDRFPKYALDLPNKLDLKDLFDHQVSDYKAGLVRLDTNLGAQALVVATAILVIIRRSDSLNFFGNSIPLSWLHVFIPILLIVLFMGFGYISHRLIAGRMLGLEVAASFLHKELFRDASWIDGWFIAFIDTNDDNVSGIARAYSTSLSILFVVVLGTLIGAAHASVLAMVSIGCRRYFATRQVRRLVWYYVFPLVPLILLLVSDFLFAYGGPHRNWYQLYVAAVSVLLMAFLLWLSAKIDSTSYPETLECLRRLRQVTLSGPIDRLPLRHSQGDGPDRRIALIGDSLSMAFHVSSFPQMLVRSRRGWKTNWFLTLPPHDQGLSVLMKLSTLGTVTGVQYASVAAMVDGAKRRSVLNHLTGTYHFCHQVDEVLSGEFPNILLIWIGHNEVDWRWRTDYLTSESLMKLSNSFIHRYETQLRRLLDGALASGSCSVIVVFGLVNFASFFDARAEAEALRSTNNLLFPHLETAYKSFVSMKPEYRGGMIELAANFNDKLEVMCNRLAEQLSGTKVRLVYSSAMSLTRMDSAAALNPIDAWHASVYGHSKLAESAYPTVYEQARLLGWVETNKPGLES